MSKSGSFLVSKERLTSSQTLPSPVLERVPPDLDEPDWGRIQSCLTQLASLKLHDEVAELTKNINRAQTHIQINRSIAEGAQAQLVLASFHNAKLHVALNEKEKGKETENVRIYDDGMGQIFTDERIRKQIKERREEKDREALAVAKRRSEAQRKKELNDAVDREWERVKAEHTYACAEWESQCRKWDAEGLPRAHHGKRPVRPTKREVRERVVRQWEEEEDRGDNDNSG